MRSLRSWLFSGWAKLHDQDLSAENPSCVFKAIIVCRIIILGMFWESSHCLCSILPNTSQLIYNTLERDHSYLL